MKHLTIGIIIGIILGAAAVYRIQYTAYTVLDECVEQNKKDHEACYSEARWYKTVNWPFED